jgi:hypothetical protein
MPSLWTPQGFGKPHRARIVQGGPQFLVLFRRRLDYSQHGWRLLHPAANRVRVFGIHTKDTPPFVIQPIHNFRLYLNDCGAALRLITAPLRGATTGIPAVQLAISRKAGKICPRCWRSRVGAGVAPFKSGHKTLPHTVLGSVQQQPAVGIAFALRLGVPLWSRAMNRHP